MVGEQELHDTFTSFVHHWRVGENFHSGRDGIGARGHGFRDTLDFDQTHAAIASHCQSFVVAEARNCGARLLARLDQRTASLDFHRFAIHKNLNFLRLCWFGFPRGFRLCSCCLKPLQLAHLHANSSEHQHFVASVLGFTFLGDDVGCRLKLHKISNVPVSNWN